MLNKKRLFLLGDVFIFTKIPDERHRKFLLKMIEFFHFMREQNDDFGEELKAIIAGNETLDAEYYDVDGNICFPSDGEIKNAKMVDWVWDQGTGKDWPFHAITGARPVFDKSP